MTGELPPFVPAITYDADVSEFRRFGPYLAPNEVEGWRRVRCAPWKDGAYVLGSTLCLSPTLPDLPVRTRAGSCPTTS